MSTTKPYKKAMVSSTKTVVACRITARTQGCRPRSSLFTMTVCRTQ